MQESYRVLVSGGTFINYSLNRTVMVEVLYKILNKNYHIKGEIDSLFLERSSIKQLKTIETIFNTKVNSRFTEILFKPELKFHYPGKVNNLLGKIDSWLSGSFFALKWFARQQSYMVKKID